MPTFTGKDLQAMMLGNRKSLTLSAKTLGISVDELKSYFEYESFEDEFIDNIFQKLQLLFFIDSPKSITPAGLDIIEGCEREINLLRKLLKASYETNKASYEIIKMVAPVYARKEMKRGLELFEKYIKTLQNA